MKTLAIVTGPTASGKTALAVELAQWLGTEIVSADSRQVYKGLPIGTAVPSAAELASVRHHFIEVLPVDAYYSAAMYEAEALGRLGELWRSRDTVVMCGGSMMYIDAVTHGIDPLPTISPGVRARVTELYETRGLDAVKEELARLDPVYLAGCDRQNPRRLLHGLEICLEAGVPCSVLRTGRRRERGFRVVKMAIGHTREALFGRINARVDAMMEAGLLDEARAHRHQRHLNALNTVGYKELFAYMDGEMDLATATARIAKNTRVYAKKQLLWLGKDPDVHVLDPGSGLLPQALAALE